MPLVYQALIALFISGGLGATTRHFVSLGIQRLFGVQAFWSILIINLVGCFIIGVISGLFLRPPHETVRIFIITGFIGSFTTYSTFMLDIVGLTQKGMNFTALFYLLLHLVVGFVLCSVGLMIGRALIHA